MIAYWILLPVTEHYFGGLRGMPGFGTSRTYLYTEPHQVQLLWVDWRPVWPLDGNAAVWLTPGKHRIGGIANGRRFAYDVDIWRHETYTELDL